MDELTFIKSTTISSTDVCKNWYKIVKEVNENNQPAVVCTDNTPEVVILSDEQFLKMQESVEAVHRETLGQKMVRDLFEIAALTDQPIRHMRLNKNGVFVESM